MASDDTQRDGFIRFNWNKSSKNEKTKTKKTNALHIKFGIVCLSKTDGSFRAI